MTDQEIIALAKRKGVGVARASEGWWTVWWGHWGHGNMAMMRDENLVKSLQDRVDKRATVFDWEGWALLGWILLSSFLLYMIYALSVWGCRFTVWMGTEAKVWPW